MTLSRIALRLGALLQFAGGAVLAIDAILAIIREGPPRGPWTTLYLLALGLLALFGGWLAWLAIGVARRQRWPWCVSLFLGACLLFRIGGAALAIHALLLIAGAPSVWRKRLTS